MFYTKTKLISKLQRHFKLITEISETDSKLILQADNQRLEIKKIPVANYNREMILMYQY